MLTQGSKMNFGISVVDITPPFPTMMGGYGARQDYFDTVNDRLSCTILVLESKGKTILIAAADLVSFFNEEVTALREQLAEVIGSSADNVMLNVSHTHGGPAIKVDAASSIEGLKASVDYRKWLHGEIVKGAQVAMSNMRQGSLWYGLGKSALPMNRRLERDGTIVNAPNPAGAVDDRLHVLALRDHSGKLCALGITLSCHPVTTGAQHLITADFPGAFRNACREALGDDITPFFLQGAGGDMRPRPAAAGNKWQAVPHSKLPMIGYQLLQETMTVLNNSQAMEELKNLEFVGHAAQATVKCEKCYSSKADLENMAVSSVEQERVYAANALETIEKGEMLPSQVNVGVHTIWLNRDIAIVGIQGEPLIGLGSYVEKSLAPKRILLLGYVNGCIGYLPDTKEMKRGGYENKSYLYSGWSGPFAPGLEETIASAVFKEPSQN